MGDGHHLVHGTLVDYLTGEVLDDTDDERYRQKLARFLVEDKGYPRSGLKPRFRHDISTGDICAHSVTDLVVFRRDRIAMLLRYGPGSLVTRERPALAAARTISNRYTVPLAVVTNGEDAEILETGGGDIVGRGLDAIPSPEDLDRQFERARWEPVGERQRTAEKRILIAFDGIEHSCACTEDWCRPR